MFLGNKKIYLVPFFFILFYIKNGYCDINAAKGSGPFDVIKQLKLDPNLKLEQFSLLVDTNRLKNTSGNVIQGTQDIMSEAVAKKILKNKLIQLKLLFAPQAAAYPGMFTRDQHCQQSATFAKKIEYTKDAIFWHSEMPGSDNFTYGSCGSREEPYQSQYLLIYCKKIKTLFDIRYFQLKNKEEVKIDRAIATCK